MTLFGKIEQARRWTASYVHKSISFSKLEKVMIQDIGALPIKVKLPECKSFCSSNVVQTRGRG